MGEAFPSDVFSLERCHARSAPHALLEEKMALLCVWLPGRAEHLWISPPSLHEAEELKAFPGVVFERVPPDAGRSPDWHFYRHGPASHTDDTAPEEPPQYTPLPVAPLDSVPPGCDNEHIADWCCVD